MRDFLFKGLASKLQADIVAPKPRACAPGAGAASMLSYMTKDAPEGMQLPDREMTYQVKFKPASKAELKALGDDLPDGFVAGWASTKDMDLYRHRVMPGAFQEAINKRGLSGSKGIKFLANHDWRQVAGIIKKLEYRNGDLWIEAQFNLNISYAKDMYEASKMNDGLSFSVGFMPEKYAIEKDSDEREWLRIDKGDLYEVSAVPFPGNEEAGMVYVKGRSTATVAQFEKWLIETGLAKSRNDAKRVTQAVKSMVAEFEKEAPVTPVVPVLPVNDPPMLAVEKVAELTALVAKMKAMLSAP